MTKTLPLLEQNTSSNLRKSRIAEAIRAMTCLERLSVFTQTPRTPIGVTCRKLFILVLISYYSELAHASLEKDGKSPRGMVSITRGVAPTRGELFDDEHCDFSGTIVLGGLFSLESDDKFFTFGSHQLTSFNLMIDHINRYKCGIQLEALGPDNLVKERNYALELRTYDDQSNLRGSLEVGQMLASEPSVDILVGGYSSTLTQPYVEAAQNHSEKLVLSPGAAFTEVFLDKPFAFGLLPPSSKYLLQAIKALATIHGTQTMATVWEDASFTRGVCASAPKLAEIYGMTMTSTTEVTKTPNTTVLEPVAESLKEEDPDVVITCVYDCTPWIQAMRRANWSPKAQVFTICVGQEKFSNQAGADTEYIMGVVPWDSSLQMKDAVTGWSASEFASRFRGALSGEETLDCPYQAAMAAALISVLYQAIQAVNGFRQNGPELANYISKNSFQTLGGNFIFDENGQSEAPSLLVQYNTDGVVQTVYPIDAASGPILYPMPTWDHRDCIQLSECERRNGDATNAFLNTGNVCNDKGMCVCGDPLNFKSVGLGANANCIQLEEMNYIMFSLKVLSWILCGLLLVFSAFCLGWTYRYRKNTLVRVSQPLFLSFLVAGSILSTLSIIPMGIEGSYREDTENITAVDAACMAFPWLWAMGFALTYSALFAKVRRVHKLYQLASKMRRIKVDYREFFFIIFIVLAAEMIVLIAFQMVSPLAWQRDVIEDMGGHSIESIGTCHSESGWWFFAALVTMNVICLFIALVLCWQTKDLPSDFSESNYIFLSVMFMFQILMLAVPVSVMVQEDTNVFFFIRVGAVFLQNFTVLGLIFLPKMRRIYVGEDTDMSIKNAIMTEQGFREVSSKGRLSFYSKSPSKYLTDSKEGSLDSFEIVSSDGDSLPPPGRKEFLEPFGKPKSQITKINSENDDNTVNRRVSWNTRASSEGQIRVPGILKVESKKPSK